MHRDGTPDTWTKDIPPACDRLQSRILVWTVAPLLAANAVWTIGSRIPQHHYLLAELAISLSFALVTWLLKAATPGAAACGGIICLLLTDWSISSPPSLLYSGLPPLAVLFILTFAATRFGRARKEARGLSESRTGRRTSQVIANLGVAALCTAFDHSQRNPSWLFAYSSALAALAEATADTLSSEIGQAIGGPAVLITTFRRVTPGTDGAISLAGTLAGLIGAAIVIYAGLPRFPPFLTTAVFAAATLGLFFDSLLGATLERRGYLGNDLVNFASTAFAAAIVFPLAHIASLFAGR